MKQLPAIPVHMDLASGAITDAENERLLATGVPLPKNLAECHTCNGRGAFRFYETMDAPYEARPIADYQCPCADQFALQRYLYSRGIPAHYARLFWKDATHLDPAAIALVNDYAGKYENYLRHGMGLFLDGTYGAGKSLIASLLLKRVLSGGYDGYWTTFVDLLDLYAGTWRGDKEAKEWFDNRVRSARLLVVDDIGQEYEKRDSAISSIDAIFRARVQAGNPTIITTNKTREFFEARYTAGMQSLMNEACIMHRVAAPNGDIRKVIGDRKRYEVSNDLTRPFTLGAL